MKVKNQKWERGNGTMKTETHEKRKVRTLHMKTKSRNTGNENIANEIDVHI